MKFPEQYRKQATASPYESNGGDKQGVFMIPKLQVKEKGKSFSTRPLLVIATNGDVDDQGTNMGWEHVSVSVLKNREATPNWREMCLVKNLFWSEQDVVLQYHPAKSSYVNLHPGCLHLWRPTQEEIPVPPSICV